MYSIEFATVAPARAGVVRLTATGCTSTGSAEPDPACLPGASGRADARAQVTVLLARLPALATAPAATVTLAGSFEPKGAGASVDLYNTDTGTRGITVHAGGAVDAGKVKVTTVPGTPPLDTLLGGAELPPESVELIVTDDGQTPLFSQSGTQPPARIVHGLRRFHAARQAARQPEHAAHVVAVLVRDEDAVDRGRLAAEPREPALGLAQPEAAVDQHAEGATARRARRLDQQSVALAAAPEACETHLAGGLQRSWSRSSPTICDAIRRSTSLEGAEPSSASTPTRDPGCDGSTTIRYRRPDRSLAGLPVPNTRSSTPVLRASCSGST